MTKIIVKLNIVLLHILSLRYQRWLVNGKPKSPFSISDATSSAIMYTSQYRTIAKFVINETFLDYASSRGVQTIYTKVTKTRVNAKENTKKSTVAKVIQNFLLSLSIFLLFFSEFFFFFFYFAFTANFLIFLLFFSYLESPSLAFSLLNYSINDYIPITTNTTAASSRIMLFLTFCQGIYRIMHKSTQAI